MRIQVLTLTLVVMALTACLRVPPRPLGGVHRDTDRQAPKSGLFVKARAPSPGGVNPPSGAAN